MAISKNIDLVYLSFERQFIVAGKKEIAIRKFYKLIVIVVCLDEDNSKTKRSALFYAVELSFDLTSPVVFGAIIPDCIVYYKNLRGFVS